MCLHFETVTAKNRGAVERLALLPEQAGFIESPAECRARPTHLISGGGGHLRRHGAWWALPCTVTFPFWARASSGLTAC